MIRFLAVILTFFMLVGQLSAYAPAYRFDLPEKSPLIVPVVESHEKIELLPVKELFLYYGAKVTFKSLQRQLLVEKNSEKIYLTLDDTWAFFESGKRKPLLEALSTRNGRFCLVREDLLYLLEFIGGSKPVFTQASGLEAQPTSTPLLDVIPDATEPEVVVAPEPQLILTPAQTPPVNLIKDKIRFIVIDPGHGGKDPGAVGRRKTYEKDVVLDIAKRVKNLFKKYFPEVKVLLTRNKDVFVELKDRAQFANQQDADLFVSIHNNASRDRSARGTQVFFYDSRSSDRAAGDLARWENSDANFLEIMMMDLAKSLVRDESIALAQHVQNQLDRALKLKRRRLSYAPFYVLARTKMPALLIEAGFISSTQEEKLLRSSSFRQKVAMGIFRGIRDYRHEVEKSR